MIVDGLEKVRAGEKVTPVAVPAESRATRAVGQTPVAVPSPPATRPVEGPDQVRSRAARVSRFFVDRPIVAIVDLDPDGPAGAGGAGPALPISLYPNIAPPEILVQATYMGADALTLEKSVAAPIEQQMTGVNKMLYMYSTSAGSGGQMNLRVDFDVTHGPEHRPGAGPDARLPGRRPAARPGDSRWASA